MNRKFLAVLVACALVAGCGKGPDVSTEPEVSTVSEEKDNMTENTIKEEIKEEVKEEVKVSETETSVSKEAEPAKEENSDGELMDVTLYADFKEGCPKTFEKSGEWTNGSMFNVTWRKANCTFEDEKLQLIIDNDPKGKDIPYSGGELRSKGFYGYGRYEVSMKAIKNDGVVSSFFTYTGPSDKNPWDEIDIEFLGKNTNKVQFNYYTKGSGGHEKLVDLGFDASEDFHTYAFEWRKDRIDWFVDGELVHTATANLPKTPGKIMMNAWCGTGVDSWLKAFDDSNLPLTAEYQWISFAPIEY